jgi:Uma2 family endonuclease
MSTVSQLVTAGDFLRIPNGAYRLELVEGELRKISPAGGLHGYLSIEIGSRLSDAVKRGQLGCVLGAETGFRIARDPDTVLAPDVSFIRQDRLRVIGLPQEFFPEAPALVVEVVSPSDTAEEVDDKIRRWFAAGVEVAWVVYPSGRSVTVYHGLNDIRVLTQDDTLDGGNLVPGFNCRVGDLFLLADSTRKN